MRISSVFAAACTVTAFILSVLCLFAGSSKSLLQNADLLTLNISRIGHTSLFNTSDGDRGTLDGLANDIQGNVNDLFNDAASDVADALDLPDFFLTYLMGYCKGTYRPNATALNPTEENIVCSNRTTLFHFKPTEIINNHLPSGVTLEDLHWPAGIEEIERALKVAGMAMSVFYIMGIVSGGLAVCTTLWRFCFSGWLSGCLNSGIHSLAVFTISVASIISTIIITKAVDVVNKYGDNIGIGADKGTTFLGMTWAAVIAMLLATMLSIV